MVLDRIPNALILIVDDNPVNVLLLERMLRVSGFKNIKTCTDSREVLSLYQIIKPDLLLLDLRMPHMDGYEVLELLNEVKQDDYLSVIVITAQDDKEHRLKALQLGAKDFIGKPFDHSEVLMRIRNLLEIRLLHKEVREYNRRLEEKVQERTMELEDLQVELIYRLGRVAEYRDNDTGMHVSRIGNYAFELGLAAGMNDEEAQLLLHASTMHDIGKVGIPDEILLKPGVLTADEWEKMKSHTLKGGHILAGSTFAMLKMAEEIALTHHEKWDGSGYPQGLCGDQIPLVGRITAICDVFDALISERPYKKAWPLKDAIEEIKKGRGTQFDPYLVDLFMELVPKILAIKEQYA